MLAVLGLAAGFAGPGCAQSQDKKAFSYDEFKAKDGTGISTSTTAFPKQEGGVFGERQKIDQTQPLNLQGDQLLYDKQGNRVIARGNVEIFYNNYILTADEVIYDQNANTLTAVGNVTLKDPSGNVIRADRYTLTDDFRDGFVQSLSIVSKDDTRITAERATRKDGNVTEFESAKFTPCKTRDGMPPLWCLSAGQVIHDQQAATITYYNATFDFFGVPIVYLPFFQHADATVKRKSGFLLPVYSHSDRLGSTIEVPYFWAIAPNYDVTIHPRYMTDGGLLYQGEWRHRLEGGQYSIKLAAIDQDSDDLEADDTFRDDLEGWRGSVKTRGVFSLASWWKLGWDVTIESDDQFRRYYQLDSVLLTDRVNNIYLRGQSDRNYFAANFYQFGGLLLDDTQEAESRVHPIIDYNVVFADPVLGGEVTWKSNFLSFSRSDVDINPTALVDGRQQDLTRAVTELKWRRQFTDQIGISYTPFANLRGDVYNLNNYMDPDSGEIVRDDTIVRGIATGGATVSYPWIAGNSVSTHIIEPIGQIVTRQDSVTQERLPNEDAKSLLFDETVLFDPDKFSGYDRVETGTRANVGLQYTFQLHSGGYARLLAGQSFHLSGENAYEDPGIDTDGQPVFSRHSGLEKDRSDYVLGAYIAPSEMFRFISQSRFDEDTLELRREDLAARLIFGPLVTQATYSYTSADPTLFNEKSQEEAILAASLKITDYWSVLGTLRYDLDDERMLQDTVSIRYADECFVLMATYAESFIEDEQQLIEPDRSVMLRFEFKHLGAFGYSTDILDSEYGDGSETKVD